MPKARIVYQDWIVALGRDPGEPPAAEPSTDGAEGVDSAGRRHQERLRDEVDAAIRQLDIDEQELIRRFHFMGQSYRDIAERTGRTRHKLEALHNRALRKLKRILAPLVAVHFGIATKAAQACPICRSDHRGTIDALLATKRPEETWRPYLRQLADDFDIVIRSPQQLIGHIKYH